MLRGAGVDEVEWHVGRAADVLVGEGSGGALVAAAHQALAHEVHDDHKHQQDDGDDRPDGGGAGGQVAGQRGVCSWGEGTLWNKGQCEWRPVCVL